MRTLLTFGDKAVSLAHTVWHPSTFRSRKQSNLNWTWLTTTNSYQCKNCTKRSLKTLPCRRQIIQRCQRLPNSTNLRNWKPGRAAFADYTAGLIHQDPFESTKKCTHGRGQSVWHDGFTHVEEWVRTVTTCTSPPEICPAPWSSLADWHIQFQACVAVSVCPKPIH